MLLKRSILIFILFASFSLSAFSQTDSIPLATLAEKAANYNNRFTVEKVYLHFDKPYYAVGDTIWFKAYVTADSYGVLQQHVPSILSNVVYVDIIGAKDTIVQKLKLAANKGVAFGNFILSKTQYQQGNYHIRAYTKWMRNFDAAYFFDKTIAIGDAINKKLLTNFTLSSSTQNNTAKVSARINYRDQAGSPIAGKKVSWKVQTPADEVLGKGKETTDANGNITIAFNTNKITDLRASDLVAEIDADPKEEINHFSLKSAAAPPDIQFFPEGGDMIAGVPSKIAFKAIQANGQGVDVKGTITDNAGATVANFTSQHLGMGTFDMIPAAGKTYKAAVTFADGTTSNFDLPKVSAEDITLSVSNVTADRINIRLLCNDAFLQKNKGKRFYIVAQNGQAIFYAAQTPPLAAVMYPANLPNKLPSGICKITLMANTGEALSERLVFIRKDDGLALTLNSTKSNYGQRQQVMMNIGAKNPAQQPTEANLSITVIDETKVPFDENAETTILSYLLLTSDLKGYIEKPNYYFSKPDAKTDAALDVLMLTQGYRRFTYKDIVANKNPEIKFLPEDGITITGSLRTGTGMPVNRGNINFEIKERRLSVNVPTNTVGEFKINKLYFPDSLQASVSARGNTNSNNMMILVDNESYQPVTAGLNMADGILNIDSAMRPYLQNSKKVNDNSRVLEQVNIRATAIPQVKKASHADNSALTGLSIMADHTIDGSLFSSCPTMFDCLRSMATGITADGEYLYLSRGYNQGNKIPVAIYMDGFMVDYNSTRSIDPKQVESVEVFMNDGVSGINKMSNTNGVLVINMKKTAKVKMSRDEIQAKLAELMPPNSGVKIKPKGFSMARSFYSPRYDVSTTASFGGDLRSTIYWNPRVTTDKTTGTASIDFYNADERGSFRAIVEGIDADGNIGRAVYKYKVQ